SDHNQFSITVEKDGVTWDVFTPSLTTGQGHATLLLSLASEGALQGMADSEITFQIVARPITTDGSNSRSTASSSADITVFVSSLQTSPLVSNAGGDDFSTAEVVIVALVITLLLFIVFAIVYVVHKTRRKKTSAMPVFRRNSKYYVSKRANSNGQLPQLDSSPATPASPSVVRRVDQEEEGVSRNTVMGEELSQRPSSDLLYEPYVSQKKSITLQEKSPSGTDSSVLESFSSAAGSTFGSTDKHTVSAAANRNRCDVTLLASKTELDQQLAGSDPPGDSVSSAPCPSSGDIRTESQVRSQDALLSLLDTPRSDKDQCDVTTIEEAGTTVDQSPTVRGAKAGYVNVKAGAVSTPEAAKPVCDVAPLSESLAVANQGLTGLLDKVNRKLAQGGDAKEMGADRRCDVVPLPSTEQVSKETPVPDIDLNNSDPAPTDSRKSSLSNISTTDVAPLIKQDGGKKNVSKKQSLQEPTNTKPTMQGQSNPAFSEQTPYHIRDSTGASISDTPVLKVHIPNSRNMQNTNAASRSYSTEDQKMNSKGQFNLIHKSGQMSPKATTPIKYKVPVTPVAHKKALPSPKKVVAPPAFQLSQPNVPPVALALPSFTGAPAFPEDYVIITNPVYESSTSIYKTPVSSSVVPAYQTHRPQRETAPVSTNGTHRPQRETAPVSTNGTHSPQREDPPSSPRAANERNQENENIL
ncbi:hypothetical protein EGW08_004923, partial [Elysia chlorotica]